MRKTFLKLAVCLGLCVALCSAGFIGACGDATDDPGNTSNSDGWNASIVDYFTFKNGLSNTLAYDGSYTLAFYTNYRGNSIDNPYEVLAYDGSNGHMYAAQEGAIYYYYVETADGLTEYIDESKVVFTDDDTNLDYKIYNTYELDSSNYAAYKERTSFSYVAESLLDDPTNILSEDGVRDYISQMAYSYTYGMSFFSGSLLSISVSPTDEGATVYTVKGNASDVQQGYVWNFELQVVFANNYLTEVICNASIDSTSIITGLIKGNDYDTENVVVDVVISYDFDSSLWPDTFENYFPVSYYRSGI